MSLMPLFVGQLDALASLNERQLMVAVALGAAAGGILLAVAWRASAAGHPLLDALGASGRWPLLALWACWAGALSVVTLSWAGAALSAVTFLPAPMSAALIALLAALLSREARRERPRAWAATVTAVLTGAALMAVAPHILASSRPGLWQGADNLLGQGRVGPNPYPFATEWRVFRARLIDVGGLATATVLLWAPMRVARSPEPSGAGSWWVTGQAFLVAAVVSALTYISTATRWGAGLPTGVSLVNPMSLLLSLRGPGLWRDMLVGAFTGSAILGLRTVWAGGPPVEGVSPPVKRGATWLAGSAAVILAVVLTRTPLDAVVATSFQRQGDGVFRQLAFSLIGGAYLFAPLVGIAGVKLLGPVRATGSSVANRKPFHEGLWGPLAFAGGLMASLPWAHGFGWLSFGPYVHRWIPPLPAHAAAFVTAPPADWALMVSTLVSALIFSTGSGLEKLICQHSDAEATGSPPVGSSHRQD